MKAYIASGWFNATQLAACVQLEQFCIDNDINHFAPRKMNLGTDGVDWDLIFQKNIEHLDDCDIVFASTVGKDMGTIWETGYAYAKGKEIIYYTPGITKPNLMLAKSGQIARDINELGACFVDRDVTFVGDEIE